MTNLTLLGGGMMGEALLAGWLRSGWQPADVTVIEPRAERRLELAQQYQVATTDVVSGVGADLLVLATKPQSFPDVAGQLVGSLNRSTLVVSIMAGISTARLEDAFAGQPVIRVMPNTPAQISAGVSAVSAGQFATSAQLAQAVALLEPVGSTVVVPESYQDAVTALSGSGPAYLFFLAECLISAGIEIGLPEDVARQLAVDTLAGSAQLLQRSGQSPSQLRANVTSPGGTTAAAIAEFEAGGVRPAISNALRAAASRSQELGQGEIS